jgi:hypothetical protein
MKSRGWVWSACVLGAIVALLTALCVLGAGGAWMVRSNPALQQALRQLASTATPTSSPTTTDTPTTTPTVSPTATSIPTATPTATQVTPVVLDAPATHTPVATPLPTATETPFPTATSTPEPTRRPVPTKALSGFSTTVAVSPAISTTEMVTPTTVLTPTVAAVPFTIIGTRAVLSPAANGVTGSAVLFSPREFTMIGFNYDGQCPIADIRLSKEGFPKPPVSVLLYLEPRPYKDESLRVPIPADVAPNSANALFVYCDTLDRMMGWGSLVPPK